VNMALNMRTLVTLFPYKDGWVKISSQGFSKGQAFPQDKMPFDSPFGLFFAAVSHFGCHGIHVHIQSESPVKSALGGSSTALIALLKALSTVQAGAKHLTPKEILYLAYQLEDAVGGGNCGIQDQAAAVYGGVHQWLWRYGEPKVLYRKVPLLDRKGQKALSQRILVAYSGKAHVSSRTNRNWIKGFLSGRTRTGWIEANEVVHRFARAIQGQQWEEAAWFVREEMAIRRKLTPEALTPVTAKLVSQAEQVGCGARFAGAGAGGSLWAIGELDRIERLKEVWEKALKPIKTARILPCALDAAGVVQGEGLYMEG